MRLLRTCVALAATSAGALALVACDGGTTGPDVVDVAADDAGEDTGTDDVQVDAGRAVTATGGTVDLLHFAVFGDVRPPVEDDTTRYPRAVFQSVVDSVASLDPQFAVATGDYMFASTIHASIVNEQVDIFLGIEQRYPGHVFHAFGNHECTGATLSNCANGNETPNVMAFRSRLIPQQPALYYDWTVRTAMGDAHFIATAPNAWSSSQDAWLTRKLAEPARYVFVVAHVPPTSPTQPSSSAVIERAVMMRTGGVTLRLFGHSHSGRRIDTNGLIAGNAGAPLDGTNNVYGFAMVDQRADGDIVVTQYEAGMPPMAIASFVVHPDGTSSN